MMNQAQEMVKSQDRNRRARDVERMNFNPTWVGASQKGNWQENSRSEFGVDLTYVSYYF